MNFLDRAVGQSLNGGVPLTLFLLALVFGALALLYTPREEEPQIVVPVIDVNVTAPGLSARQVERQVVTPLEKLLAQIPGVEHVYSVSQTGQATVTLRFYVGEDREESLLNTYNKLYSNQHRVPPVVGNWSLRPVEVDDVPVFVVALFSEKPELYSDYELRRLADEVSTLLQTVTDTSEIDVFGGRPRTIKIQPSPEALAAHRTSLLDIVAALQTSNLLNRAGYLTFGNQLFELEAGDVVRSLDELSSLMVVKVVPGRRLIIIDLSERE
ncbi:MAG: efflux RND transporter permease subunit, partial [Pseudomonadales bacterium]